MSGEATALAVALGYAMRGWHVLPVATDKSPLTPNGFYDASDEPSTVVALWKQAPHAPGVGIRTGAESGIVV